MTSPAFKYSFIVIFLVVSSCVTKKPIASGERPFTKADSLPALIKGNFVDDYDIGYLISDTLWIQRPNIKYHILKINSKQAYFIARNDNANPSEAGLYTRIDYMSFKGMPPYEWGFCLTSYNAINDSIAEYSAQADRANPKKGCNGFPFSRMKRLTTLPNQQ